MCHVWQNPTFPAEEVSLQTLEKVPVGIDNLNITGGEPTLREDLGEIVDLLHPKARKLEISSNGLHPERLEAIIKKHPDVKIRFSLEGFEDTNNRLRGEESGFKTKVNGLKRLKELGGNDLGFALTIQDDNARDLVGIYRMTEEMGVELATSALHNGFQFFKSDNYPYDRAFVAKEIEGLISEMLKTSSVKNWFRAYLNLGLMEKVLGQDRLIPCTAATDFVFIDPWSDVYACNVRPDLKMGSLVDQSWKEVDQGEKAKRIRGQVSACRQNCWMVGSARTAMRNPKFTQLPKWEPFWWVIAQKVRVSLGKGIPFEYFVDLHSAHQFKPGKERQSYLGVGPVRRVLQKKTDKQYQPFGPFDNR
jgi:MoaA/NifB/PqqE/SkfB family radical SAM enzyme